MESRTKVLSNGAIYDMDKGRIVAMRPELARESTQITQANSGEMAAMRMERKRAVVAAAAAAAVERDDYRTKYGDSAWIAAIAEAQYIKATTPDDPKSTDAARFLLTEAGLSERQAQASPAETASDILASIARLASIAFDNSNYRKHDIVDVGSEPGEDDGEDITGAKDVADTEDIADGEDREDDGGC